MTATPETLKAIKVTDDIYWVGAIDWEIKEFHGYATGRGTTYNAYLILADKIALIDTVKRPFLDEMLSRIASVVEPSEIDYIVSNHSEMDHTGALPEAIRVIRPEKVLASTMGAKALPAHFPLPQPITPVRDGEKLSLGNRSLLFLETRMLHWPDSMMTYLPEEELLFSQDGFGMHLASGELFADRIDAAVLRDEAAKYYANILLPYSPLVLKLKARIAEAGLKIRIIAPDHGPVWRQDPLTVVGWYAAWAEQRPTRKAVVAFDTMWGSTALMARALGEGLRAGGAETRLLPLAKTTRADLVTAVLEAGGLLVGSPTLNNGVFPTVADALSYLKGLKPRNLLGLAFGSHGWSGEGTGIIAQTLEAIKAEIAGPALTAVYVPTAGNLQSCFDAGSALGRRLAGLGNSYR
jgi:flavorubredoxin